MVYLAANKGWCISSPLSPGEFSKVSDHAVIKTVALIGFF